MADFKPSAAETPFDRIGGESATRALAERFYDAMEADEPELAHLHPLEAGRVSRQARDRFALFLVGWLGGPQHYTELHGHPRLRMRHGAVPVTTRMRDAWLGCMRKALDHESVDPALRAYLGDRFTEVAEFLRNRTE